MNSHALNPFHATPVRRVFLCLLLVLLGLNPSVLVAQEFKVLHTFDHGREGVRPMEPLIQGTDGRLYGVTLDGGKAAAGTVFAINPDGTGHVVLKHFNNVGAAIADGYNPRGGLCQGDDGRLYGTTYNGGANWGTIYAINPDGSGFTVLRSFNTAPHTGNDGSAPEAALLQGSDGRLYGTTWSGGTGTRGLIFAINLDGTGYTILRQLNSAVDGGRPMGALIEGSDGRLYGTSSEYGANGAGTIFSLNKDGSTFAVLRQLVPAVDGNSPRAGLLEGSDGRLYGTAWQGGTSLGTIYAINKDGTGFSVLHNFNSAGTRGALCASQLIEGSDGRLYGTTDLGGGSNAGVIFAINKNGTGYDVLKQSGNNGEVTGARSGSGLLKGADERLYGVFSAGGANNLGTIYAIQENGTGFTVLKSMNHWGDGRNPQGKVLLASDGRLYGAARESANGGTGGNGYSFGTIYSSNGDGTDFKVLHEFPYQVGATPGGAGAYPNGDIIEGSDGRLYGTTEGGGGVHGRGLVFAMNRDGTGFVALTPGFPGNQIGIPAGGVIEGSDGKLYGTHSSGGPGGSIGGGIFSLNKNGTDYTVLRQFVPATDGGGPQAGLLEGQDGRLYGTTRAGGTYSGGTVFAMSKDGATYTVLRHLNPATDGYAPHASLVQAPDGTLYGTTTTGIGATAGGTVFSIEPDGTQFQVIHTFATSGGVGVLSRPCGGVVFGSDGRLWGVAATGGTNSFSGGGVYSLAPNGTGFALVHAFDVDVDGRVSAGTRDTDLIHGSNGVLYGVARHGGLFGQGTLFAVGNAPVITSPPSAWGTYAQPFSYTITAINQPEDFDALGLPIGLSVNHATGLISGSPAATGVFTPVIAASNSIGTDLSELTLTVQKAAATITFSNLTQTYDGTPKPVTVTTDPAGLNYSVTYDGAAAVPSSVGSHVVTASVLSDNYTGAANGILEIVAPVSPPVITSALSAEGAIDSGFGYAITATNTPTSFSATGLPPGLEVNTTTGVLSGTPTTAGIYSVLLSATNSAGTASATLTLTILPRDVTAQLQIVRSGYRINRYTKRYAQTLTVINTGGQPITGPVSLVFAGLSSNATLVSPTGSTTIATPSGSPFINLNAGSDNLLNVGESATLIIEFTNSSNQAITYTSKAFAGPGVR